MNRNRSWKKRFLKNGIKGLKNLLNKPKMPVIIIIWACISLLAAGCSMKRPAPETIPEKPSLTQKKKEHLEPVSPTLQPPKAVIQPAAPQPSRETPLSEPKPDARMLATASLVEQGKNYLDAGKPDQALGAFERALSVYPGNGRIYYYMAEAWIMKKNKHQAYEFNRLADMYLSGDPAWRDMVVDQQKCIKHLL
jgi:tetratricopeptide (TPR) repeat protein